MLLYDPDCGFCTRSAPLLGRLGPAAAIVAQTPELLATLGLDAERAAREIPFVAASGRVLWGADAVVAALRTCRTPWRALGVLLGTRAGLALGRPVYHWVARHRHRLPGGTPTCRLDPPPGPQA